MKNLAGAIECDKEIEKELTRCGIEIVKGVKTESEVPYSVTGKLGKFTFTRAWYYWVVNGNLPFNVAQELYADPVGKTDIRVNGHCGCPAPGDAGGHADWLDINGKEAVASEEKKKLDKLTEKWSAEYKIEINNKYRVSDNPEKEGFAQFITCYHIDSEIGLKIFTDTLKKYCLN